MGAKEGSDIDLDLPELGAVGKAHVLSVGPCPDIKPGEGRVLTGTFAHPPTERIIDVCLAACDVPITCTENHLFWSEDRGEFVPASQLEAGEQVGTADGSTSAITSITNHPGSRRVYNLEVHVEHVYLVSSLGVLVHNQCQVEPPSAPKGKGRLNQFTDAKERAIAEYLENLGRKVTKNPLEGVHGAGRQGDALIDGVKHEFKTLDPGANSSRLRNVVNESIKRGGQARNVVIDARASGLTQPEAIRGLRRAAGISRGKLDNITVIGDDFFINKAVSSP
jgi:hypothetical protein